MASAQSPDGSCRAGQVHPTPLGTGFPHHPGLDRAPTAPDPDRAPEQAQRHTQGPTDMSLTGLHITCHQGIGLLHRREDIVAASLAASLPHLPVPAHAGPRGFPPPLPGHPQRLVLQARRLPAALSSRELALSGSQLVPPQLLCPGWVPCLQRSLCVKILLPPFPERLSLPS